MKPTVDYLAMLLSVDWAFEHWGKLGLCSSKSAKLQLQSQCRVIVARLLGGGADYWQISFSEERILDTVSAFFASVEQCGMSKEDVEFFERIVGSVGAVASRKMEDEILSTLTEVLFSLPDATSGIPLRTLDKIREFVTNAPLNKSEIVELCLGSDTSWDIWTRNLMSDMPDWLADFFIDIYPSSDRFRRFWAQVEASVSCDERTHLISWYRQASFELLGHVVVP